MNVKFTIEELKLANELCFPSNFKELLKKHLPESEQDMVSYYVGCFLNIKSNLITWIFGFSRADDKRTFWGEVNQKIVLDLLHKV